ncbi:DUF421 domain-containing protein [Siminovitchia sp. FSL H7-0308]|uniref:Uncharacterized membrane protein YcaP (DUF421 family) n=1 Tax=Siminovitchia thermophila TaxID=1245522 RepID=A0ABS2RET0_9BACI|nr:DUF421 domain-containing protein [Siminovitchia thermophila]MBM7717373.1 uncharacterized membrane protein YcaP (DUF421 family) [Siminovitchia thermophila]ONK22923.1 hypothetical protein BLX87_13340 [Bacillus sp. VT-16-64]
MEIPEWLNIVLRSLFLVFFLFLLTKWLGKKQLSQLSFFEYVAGITLGSIAAELSTGLERNMLPGIYSMFVWAGIPFIAGLLALKSKKARNFIEGQEVVVIKNGKIQEESLTKEKYTVEELLHLLRKKNVFNIADVEFAVLEANGDLNVMFKKEKQPITPKDLQMEVAPERPPHTVILEGKIMDSGLSASGMTREWLDVELKKRNIALDNVYIGQVDPFGQLVVDIYDDNMQVPQPKDRPMLLSALKKCGADLETFALATEDEKAKEMYSRNAKKIEEIIQKSEHLLRQ